MITKIFITKELYKRLVSVGERAPFPNSAIAVRLGREMKDWPVFFGADVCYQIGDAIIEDRVVYLEETVIITV